MRRTAVLAALIVPVLWWGAGTATAHSEVADNEIAAGTEAVLSIDIEHGCYDDGEVGNLSPEDLDGAATIAVEVAIPAGTTLIAAETGGGWVGSAVEGDPVIARWDGGPQAANDPFSVDVRLIVPDEPGARVLLPVIQSCVAGTELAWLDEDPEAPRPAPFFVVVERPADVAPATTQAPVTTGAPATTELNVASETIGDDGGSNLAVLVGVAVAIGGGAIVIWQTMRSKGGPVTDGGRSRE